MIGQLDLDLANHDRATTDADPRFAELVAHRTHGRQPSADDIFDFGFDLILTGLRHTLHTSRDTQPNR